MWRFQARGPGQPGPALSLPELRAAVEAADWPRALALALDAWRQRRAVELADLIDAIAAKLPRESPPPARHPAMQAWWLDRAHRYKPESVAALVDTARQRLLKSDAPPGRRALDSAGTALAGLVQTLGDTGHNAIGRLVAIARWPDDPRAATIVLGWFTLGEVRWDPLSYPERQPTRMYYEALADRLVAIGDARVIPALRRCADEPRGPTKMIRELQTGLATRTIAKIATVPPADVADIAARLATPTASPARRDPAELWRACRDPADDAPRLVLADALQEAGDARGELIALQIHGGTKADNQARRLLTKNWATWLGDLALVLNRRGTELRRGMLEVARVGVPTTPDWAFTRVHGHRELASVHTVRPGHVKPAHYAAFLADDTLAPDRIAVDAPEVIDELRAIRSRWPIRALEYGHYSVRDGYRYEFPALSDTFAAIESTFPDLEEIRFDAMPWPQNVAGELRRLILDLPGAFPRLQRIVIDDARHMWNGLADVERELSEIRQMPLVVVARAQTT